MIRTLEIAIKAGMSQQILEIGYTESAAQQLYRCCGDFLAQGKFDEQKQFDIGRQFLIRHTEAEWSVMFAGDKLMLRDLGLISAKDGDLRKAQLRRSPEQVLGLLRWKQFREEPAPILHIISHAIKVGDYKFLRKLSEVVAKPAEHFKFCPSTPHQKFQSFLLRNWTREPPDKNGHPTPALYSFSDDGLLDYLQELHNMCRKRGQNSEYIDSVENMDSRGLRTVWERLGLIRIEHPVFHSAQAERTRRDLSKLTGKLVVRSWK
jgi:hypothetical protein